MFVNVEAEIICISNISDTDTGCNSEGWLVHLNFVT